MKDWIAGVNGLKPTIAGWDSVVHDDERFWAWIHYCSSHTLRGELYDAAFFMKDLRAIVEGWEALLVGLPRFDSRRIEKRLSEASLNMLAKTFCGPDKKQIKEAFRALISLQLRQRKLMTETKSPQWTTTDGAIRKISEMVESI